MTTGSLRALDLVGGVVAVLVSGAPTAWASGPGPGENAGESTGEAPHLAVLPPAPTWDGASRALAMPADHPWATPFEVSGLVASPPLAETLAWLDRLAAAAPEIERVDLGASPEGRPLALYVASAEGAATPKALAANGRPTLFAHAGIHSGEIDGKDAGMMLLRDLTVLDRLPGLLEGVNFLFLPVLNVDGHARRSPYGRINQRGPVETGWRTNARNLNLNRDFAKLDATETRILVRALREWRPDLYLDLHVTDGLDYRYDVTFGWNGGHGGSPSIVSWLDRALRPAVSADLRDAGHTPGPLILGAGDDPTEGIYDWTASPRFSNGYGDLVHLPTVLVENHSLKPFDRRVLGTRVLLESTLRTLAREAEGLERATAADRARRPSPVPLGFGLRPDAGRTLAFEGIGWRREASEISGAERVVWTGEPVDLEVPLVTIDRPVATAERPVAYWIPPAWTEVIEVLAAHGVVLETLAEPRTAELEHLHFGEPAFEETPFEGHVRVTAPIVATERLTESWPAGSVRVPTDQPLGDLAVVLLEPEATDSLFQWGFFDEVLDRAEYAEAYVLEPLAERMLADDPELAAEFHQRLEADEAFRDDPRARLHWFYERSPYYDARWRLYPVARERGAAETEGR